MVCLWDESSGRKTCVGGIFFVSLYFGRDLLAGYFFFD